MYVYVYATILFTSKFHEIDDKPEPLLLKTIDSISNEAQHLACNVLIPIQNKWH